MFVNCGLIFEHYSTCVISVFRLVVGIMRYHEVLCGCLVFA